MKKWIYRIGLTAIAIVILGYGGRMAYYEAMKRAWIHYNEYDIRSEGILKVGDLAPDLELTNVKGSAPVKLSTLYKDKSLVVVFGSYT